MDMLGAIVNNTITESIGVNKNTCYLLIIRFCNSQRQSITLTHN